MNHILKLPIGLININNNRQFIIELKIDVEIEIENENGEEDRTNNVPKKVRVN